MVPKSASGAISTIREPQDQGVVENNRGTKIVYCIFGKTVASAARIQG
jgi:hypothetical protein